MPPDTNAALQQIISRSDWRQTLSTDYQDTAARLLAAYDRMLPTLRDSAGLFTQRLIDYAAANDGALPGASDVQNLTEYQRLLLQVETEMRDFAALARNEASGLQDKAITTGSDAALEMITAMSGSQATIIEGMWNRPAPETLKTLIGYVDSDAFRESTSTFGTNAAQNIADVILAGVAQGKNPNAIAGLLGNWYAVPYAWADNTVRTVQLYSYRAANQASYAANPDVLNGWVWIAALDSRTCMSCISQHGTKHGLDESLNDHHQGRCTPAPWVKGTTWPDTMITGPNWFESQPESFQRQAMGGAMFNAWQAGAINWKDMSQVYHDPIYGPMLREASVSGVLGTRNASQYYVRNQDKPNTSGMIETPYGLVPRDIGKPGKTEDSLATFLNNSNGPLALAFKQSEFGIVQEDWITGAWAIEPQNVKDAAKQFVVESQNIQYGRDYILSLVQAEAASNGVTVDLKGAANLYNQQYGYQAQAIRTAADIAGIKLTDAQQRRLDSAIAGNYLSIVYTTQSSLTGSLENSTRRDKGTSGGSANMTDAARRDQRRQFLDITGRLR